MNLKLRKPVIEFNKILTLFCALVIFAVLSGCAELVSVADENPVIYEPQVIDLTAMYNESTDKVDLQWATLLPADIVNCYKLLRFSDTTSEGDYTNLSEKYITPITMSYSDTLDLLRGKIFYSIIPCKIFGDDTLHGKPSIPRQVNAGLGISYSINSGATYTIRPDVKLVIEDPNSLLQNVTFTQVADGNDIPKFNFSFVEDTANFGSNSLNMATALNGRAEFDWKLKMGGGNKKVWARMQFRPGVTTRTIDTAMSEISIKPYDVQLRIENRRIVLNPELGNDDSTGYRTGPEDGTVIFSSNVSVTGLDVSDNYVLNKPKIEFSISINMDSTFEQEFDCWVAFPDSAARFQVTGDVIRGSKYLNTSSSIIVETAPKTFKLTGVSARWHDESTIYSYDLSKIGGIENLSSFKNLSLSGSSLYPDVSRVGVTASTDVDANFNRLIKMRRGELSTFGTKEFVLVLKFKGKYFKEDRYFMTTESYLPTTNKGSGAVTKQRNRYTYFDFYCPFVYFPSPDKPYYLNNGDTVTGDFSFKLNFVEGEFSVEDKGNARISELKLIVAEKPDINWNYEEWTSDSVGVIAQRIGLATLKQKKYDVLEYNIPYRKSKYDLVQWQNIDISSWKSGSYFIAIYAKDEFGYEGITPVPFNKNTKQTNPFEIHVLNGR